MKSLNETIDPSRPRAYSKCAIGAMLFAINLTGCWSSIETTTTTRRLELPPDVRLQYGERIFDASVQWPRSSEYLTVEITGGRECQTITVPRYQTTEIENRTGKNVSRSIIFGGLAIVGGGGYAVLGVTEGNASKNMGPIVGGSLLAAAGVAFLSRGIYHALAAGTTTAAPEAHVGPPMVSTKQICDRAVVSREPIVLLLDGFAGGQFVVPLATTDLAGKMTVDVHKAMLQAFPGWPEVETHIKPRGIIVMESNKTRPLAEVALDSRPPMKYDAHQSFIRDAPRRREREADLREYRERLALLSDDEATFLANGIQIKSKIIREVEDTRHCVNLLGRVPCEALGAEQRGGLTVTHRGVVTITNRMDHPIVGIVRLYDPSAHVFVAYGNMVALGPKETKSVNVSRVQERRDNVNAEDESWRLALFSVIERRGVICMSRPVMAVDNGAIGRYQFIEGESVGSIKEWHEH